MAATLLGLAVVALGLTIIFRALGARRAARARASWPVAAGEVLEARTGERLVRDGDGDLETVYTHRLRYRYHVDGKPYEGTRILHGEAATETSDRAQDRRWRARYVPGAAVSVRHHPADPADAVLETGHGGAGGWVSLAVGGAFVVLGGVVALG